MNHKNKRRRAICYVCKPWRIMGNSKKSKIAKAIKKALASTIDILNTTI